MRQRPDIVWLDVSTLAAFVLVSLFGILLTALQLPGNWLILLAAVGYDAVYSWQRLGWKWLAALGAAALAAEGVELLSSAVAARHAGASRRAGIGALVGGFVGMIVLSVPVPILGTILGGFAGCFLGAALAEWTLHDDISRGARIGFFAMLGRLAGMVIKIGTGLAIGGTIVVLAVRTMGN